MLLLVMLLAMVGLPVAIVLLARAAQDRRNRLLAACGRPAHGHIADLGSSSDGMGSTSYWAKVQYDDDGVFTTSRVTIPYRDRGRYQAGQPVLLTFVPGRPSVVRLDS